ncbi:MAG: hypothetical protein QOF20_138 [Acidimicrobiaceae bacterium]|nr:hypothetical protein [Acidimicrobiaceae bacterium]
MRFALWPHPEDAWSVVRASALHAEATGWHGVYIADHLLPLDECLPRAAVHECWTILAGLAACTRRVRLGSLVTCAAYRLPAVIANMATTVDQISAGRLVLGVGSGWQENEFRACGLDFGTAAQRADRLEEACRILVDLLRRPRTVGGRDYSAPDAPLTAPAVKTRLPLLIGGAGPTLTLPLVAKYADEWNMWGLPQHCRTAGQLLAQHCDRLGRDITTITRSAQAVVAHPSDHSALASCYGNIPFLPVEQPQDITNAMGAYADAGVDEFIVPTLTLSDLPERLDFMDMFRQAVTETDRPSP